MYVHHVPKNQPRINNKAWLPLPHLGFNVVELFEIKSSSSSSSSSILGLWKMGSDSRASETNARGFPGGATNLATAAGSSQGGPSKSVDHRRFRNTKMICQYDVESFAGWIYFLSLTKLGTQKTGLFLKGEPQKLQVIGPRLYLAKSRSTVFVI